MRIMRELERIDFFQAFDEKKHELLLEIPDVTEHGYFMGKLLVINGVKYTPHCYYIKQDVLIVDYYDDNTSTLYTTTDYKGRLETVQEQEPTCPVCGFTYSDAFELSDSDDIECPECYAKLEVERVIDVTYTTTLVSKGEVLDLTNKVGKEE